MNASKTICPVKPDLSLTVSHNITELTWKVCLMVTAVVSLPLGVVKIKVLVIPAVEAPMRLL